MPSKMRYIGHRRCENWKRSSRRPGAKPGLRWPSETGTQTARISSSRSVFHSFHNCQQHQHSLLVGKAVSAFGKQYVTGLAMYSRLLESGNYWIRTVLAVEHVLQNMPVIYAQPPGGHSKELWDLLVEFLMPMSSYVKKKPGRLPSARMLNIRHAVAAEFKAMWNGEFGAGPAHYCHVSGGCKCAGLADKQVAIARCAKSLVRVAYVFKPKLPSEKDWTSIADPLAWLAFVLNVCNMGSAVFATSVGRIASNVVAPQHGGLPSLGLAGRGRGSHAAARQGAVGRSALDLVPAAQLPRNGPAPQEDLMDDISWHAAAGIRVKWVERHLMGTSQKFNVTLFALLVSAEEPLHCCCH